MNGKRISQRSSVKHVVFRVRLRRSRFKSCPTTLFFCDSRLDGNEHSASGHDRQAGQLSE